MATEQSGLSHKFRVFVSYSHDDRSTIEKLVAILEQMGLHPLWDKNISPGNRFTDEIAELISRSHLFMPILTPNSVQSHWVHQETGFAIALNIPVLPIGIGNVPAGMMADLQAITTQKNLSDLSEKLSQIDFEQLILPKPTIPIGTIQIAETFEERLENTVKYANWVLDRNEYGLVRVQARFSVFAVPNLPISDPIWDQREGAVKRGTRVRELQLQGRQLLERHARVANCRMIINPVLGTAKEQGDYAFEARLSTLLGFLKSMPPEKIEIVISSQTHPGTLTIVGDHFLSESRAFLLSGYVHTAFNSHPPTVFQRIRRFDQLFYEIKAQNHPYNEQAIQLIESILEKTKAEKMP